MVNGSILQMQSPCGENDLIRASLLPLNERSLVTVRLEEP